MRLTGILVYSNALTSISAGLLCLGIMNVSGTENNPIYALFAVTSVMLVYNLQRIYKAGTINPNTEWLLWVKNHRSELKIVSILTGTACLVAGWFSIQHSIFNLLTLLGVSLLSFLYVVPIGGVTLRQVPFLKNVIVAFVWTIVMVVIPNKDSIVALDCILFGIYFFGLSIPFDVRDTKVDRGSIVTVPLLIGEKYSLLLSSVCIVIFYTGFMLVHLELRTNILYLASALVPIVFTFFYSYGRSGLFTSFLDLSMAILGVSLLIV